MTDREKNKYTSPRLTKWYLKVNPPQWNPPYDIFEDDESYLVRVEIAGMKQDNFLIWMDKGHLVVTGERSGIEIAETIHNAINYGKFNVQIHLDRPINESLVEANYQNGFLNIFLPKQLKEKSE